MNAKRLSAATAAILVVLLVAIAAYSQSSRITLTLPAGADADVTCDGEELAVDHEAGSTSAGLECVAQAVATATTVPDTATPEPADTPTPEPAGDLCSHDDRAWHALEGDGCHFDHEHKDDPHALDHVFGTQIYEQAGGEISYPWQTAHAGTVENRDKHGGYGYLVRDNSAHCSAGDADGCIRYVRLQYHALMHAEGATTRFHSYYAEIQACKAGDCGILRVGGHADFGILVEEDEDAKRDHIPLPSDPDDLDGIQHQRREHGSLDSRRRDATWYGPGQNDFGLGFALRGEAWGNVNPDDPFQSHFFCPSYDCEYNGSEMELAVLPFRLKAYNVDDLGIFPDEAGLFTATGYLTPDGDRAAGCNTPSADCVPFSIEGMPAMLTQYRDDRNDLTCRTSAVRCDGGRGDYDTSPDGEAWIVYPN